MSVVDELKVIAQDDYPMKVREVCADAAEEINYHRALLARMAAHEKKLRDELDEIRGVIR